jgi:siroheme synthase (precorrin-2 oxidase/ferrochelatase)
MTIAVSSDGRDVRRSIRLRDRLKHLLSPRGAGAGDR